MLCNQDEQICLKWKATEDFTQQTKLQNFDQQNPSNIIKTQMHKHVKWPGVTTWGNISLISEWIVVSHVWKEAAAAVIFCVMINYRNIV